MLQMSVRMVPSQVANLQQSGQSGNAQMRTAQTVSWDGRPQETGLLGLIGLATL